MQVLLEVIPYEMSANQLDRHGDYESFTIRSIEGAQEIFDAEYRKLCSDEDVARLTGFFESARVWTRIRLALNSDRHFRGIDLYMELGTESCTYRLSPYIAGKRSK